MDIQYTYIGSVLLPVTVSKQISSFWNKAFTNHHHPLLQVIGSAPPKEKICVPFGGVHCVFFGKSRVRYMSSWFLGFGHVVLAH